MILKKLYEKKIIQEGNFTLKCGEKSNIYIDLRKVISYPEIHLKICDEISKKIKFNNVDLVCGTPYGAVSYTSYVSISNKLPMIFLRKEKKNYGTKKLVEGVYSKNNKVILIEDVTTTGGSVCDAAKCLESHGLNVVQIITIISRNKNKKMCYKKVPIEYLYHIDDINIKNN